MQLNNAMQLNSRFLLVAILAASASLVVGCERGSSTGGDVVRPIRLKFEHGAENVADHPFPSDEYIDQTFQLAGLVPGLLATPAVQGGGGAAVDTTDGGFSAAQAEHGNYLTQLGLARRRAYSVNTGFRIPFELDASRPQSRIDLSTAPGAIRLYDVTDQVATPVALGDDANGETRTTRLGESIEFVSAIDDLRLGSLSNAITVRPRSPLEANRTYGLVVLAGRIETLGGGEVIPSHEYEEIQRFDTDPLTDASFARVRAADADIGSRADTLCYVEVTTQDDTAQLDSLYHAVNGEADIIDPTVNSDSRIQASQGEIAVDGITLVLDQPAQIDAFFTAAGAGLLTPLNNAIGKIVAGTIRGPNFRRDISFDTQDLFSNETFARLPTGQWVLATSRPYHEIPFIAFFPPTGNPAGNPVTVALHDFGRQKEDFLTIASFVNQTGGVVVAIDAVQHGDRQLVEGSSTDKVDAALAVLGVQFPDPFLGATFLARTRDKVRQSMVDAMSMVRLLTEANGTNPAIDLSADGAGDNYGAVSLVGVGLGGMIGVGVAAVTDEVTFSVTNGIGGGLATIFRESPTIGDLYNFQAFGTANATGFGILGESEVALFTDSAEREVYDIVSDNLLAAVDPTTFAEPLATGRLRNLGGTGISGDGVPVLYQFGDGDLVVPNGASTRLVRAIEGAVLGGLHEGASRSPVTQVLFDTSQSFFDMGLLGAPFDADDAGFPFQGAAITQFSSSNAHAFLLDPTQDDFFDAVSQAVQYLASGTVGPIP